MAAEGREYLLNHLRDLYGEETLLTNPSFNTARLVKDQQKTSTGRLVHICKSGSREEQKFDWQTRYFAIDYFNEFTAPPMCPSASVGPL